MQKHRVPLARVRTHQEWPSAHTACPGKALQREMVTMRSKALASIAVSGDEGFAIA